MKDEFDLLKILQENKGAANNKLQAWLAKNAPAVTIPEVDPPSPPVVIVVPDDDKPVDNNTTNPAPDSNDTQNGNETKS